MRTPPAPATLPADTGFRAKLIAQLGLPPTAGDGQLTGAFEDLVAYARAADEVPLGYVSAKTYEATRSALRQARAQIALIRALDADAGQVSFRAKLRSRLGLPPAAGDDAVTDALDAILPAVQRGAAHPSGYVTREAYVTLCLDHAAATAAVAALRALAGRAIDGADAAFLAALRDRLGLAPSAGLPAIAVRLAHLIADTHFGCGAWPGFVLRAVGEVAYRDLAAALAAIGAEPRATDASTAAFPPAHQLARAANRAEDVDAERAIATGIALNAEGGKGAPEWVQLMPAGPLVAGRDGRKFTITDPAAIVTATVSAGLPLVIDFEHATELGAKGGDGKAPAAGWIEALEVRNGQIWGRVSWTDRASKAVASREYRFLSPVFLHTRDDSKAVLVLCSAGLVHRPNFEMKALNAREDEGLLGTLRKIFGLPKTASEVEVLQAARALKDASSRAANAAEPSPDRYVPMDVHETAVRALNAATSQLAERDAAHVKDRAQRLLEEAVTSGRVTPAMRPSLEAMALNNYAAVEAMVGAMPVIVPGGESRQVEEARRSLAQGHTGGLTEQQRTICAQLGLDEADYARSIADTGART